MSDSTLPARPSWSPRPAQPYEPGNLEAVRHGAYSERMIAERAEQVHAEITAVAPWLDDDRYMPALAAYLRAVAREQLAQRALDGWDGKGRFPSRLVETATAAARLAWQMGDELGLTPAGHARLKALTAEAVGAEASLADLLESGRKTRLAAQARQEPPQAAVPADSDVPPSEPSEGDTGPQSGPREDDDR